MKTNCWIFFGMTLTTSLLAQQATNTTTAPAVPAAPPAAAAVTNVEATAQTKTNAPAAKAGKKKSSAKKSEKKSAPKKSAPAAELKTVPLVPGPATVIASNVNVRAQAKLKSEVVGRVTKGQQVTVLQEIVRNDSGADEPSAWAKITLPSDAQAWVFSPLLTNKTAAKRAKIRGGPGENYTMIGILDRGQSVTELTTKGEWTRIEPPSNAYAFVAAQFLKQGEEPATVAATTPTPTPPPAPTPPEPAPTTTTVPETPSVAPAPTEPPATTPPPTTSETPSTPPAVTPAPATTNAPEPALEEPPPKRIVQHEGFVRGMTSIQAPSHFALVSPDNGKVIDYLHTTSRELDLRRYKGLRIVVTGEESLDERWGNTPVITIQKIQVVDEAR